jgi:hypothetical protein
MANTVAPTGAPIFKAGQLVPSEFCSHWAAAVVMAVTANAFPNQLFVWRPF